MGSHKYLQAAETAIRTFLSPGEDDRCIILCDRSGKSLAELFYQAFEKLSNRIVFMQSPLPAIYNGELDGLLKGAFGKTTLAVVILPDIVPASLPTWLSHRPGNRILCIHAAMPQTFLRWLKAARPRSIEKTEKLADLLSIGKKMSLKTPQGADLTVPLSRRVGIPDARNTQRANFIAFLPSGEVRLQPGLKTVSGMWQVNFIAGSKNDNRPIDITLKDGRLVKVRGQSPIANAIRKFFKEHGPEARQILEISVGTNDNFSFGRSAIEDRKVRGACTITFGNPNAITGGHHFETLSLVTTGATIAIDGRTILENGELLI